MKKVFCFLLSLEVITVCRGNVIAESAVTINHIIRSALNENQIVLVPTFPKVTTTIRFPYPIQALDGAGFTTDRNQIAGDFELSWSEGNNFFAFTPIIPNAFRNINVVVNGKTFVFEAFPASSRAQAVMSIIMEDSSINSFEEIQFNKTQTEPESKLKPSGGAKLLGLIDTLKMLAGQSPSSVETILNKSPNLSLSIRDNDIFDFNTYKIGLTKILRNNEMDAIAFEVIVENTSTNHLFLEPESFTVRVGDSIYDAVISDINPDLPKKKTQTGYFVMIGTPDGSPNWLDVNNNFIPSFDVLTLDSVVKIEEVIAPISDNKVIKSTKVKRERHER